MSNENNKKQYYRNIQFIINDLENTILADDLTKRKWIEYCSKLSQEAAHFSNVDILNLKKKLIGIVQPLKHEGEEQFLDDCYADNHGDSNNPDEHRIEMYQPIPNTPENRRYFRKALYIFLCTTGLLVGGVIYYELRATFLDEPIDDGSIIGNPLD